jgi:hypothetical protein
MLQPPILDLGYKNENILKNGMGKDLAGSLRPKPI